MTDEELMRAYADGDVKAFELLYRRHKSRIFGFLVERLKSRQEAEEVFQEIFVKLHNNRFKYREEIPFLAWLFTLAKNSMIDHIRKSNTRGKYLELSPEAVSDAPDIKSADKDVNEAISGLSSLSGEQRMLLSMRFNEGLSFSEIAESMNISQPNARKIVSRAIQKLRVLILGKEQ
ncbi:MAG: sigma-70 family RNA polymerase sigma factor [Sedimenticola sp.]|nr:sigma-70 family RNA polymerase sigma factor [Sedimenticola sp.]MCW8920042.1 sigma-70 family RNA polymerase sigma factor [Sedimenticola sp.]MCW8946959.1 sigma-70 family RNA polymerase sigma factor [Sedimenticola sp.]MCW8950741.1 sigma-70 family RNA polymerase sigma factor [Sedimenticola sp.]